MDALQELSETHDLSDLKRDRDPVEISSFFKTSVEIFIIFFALCFSFFQLKSAPIFVPVTACLLSFSGAVVWFYFRQTHQWFYLGLCLPLASIVGPGALNLTLGGVLLGEALSRIFRRVSSHHTSQAHSQIQLAVSGLIVAWGIASLKTIIETFDSLLLQSILTDGGIFAAYQFLTFNPPPWLQALQEFFGVCLAVRCFLLLVRAEAERTDRSLFSGVVVGVLLGVFYFLGQFFALHPAFDINRGPFWALQGRYSGSFSDPNALGVMAVLLAPLLVAHGMAWWGKSKLTSLLSYFAVLSLLAMAPFSGSRTFFLGIAALFVAIVSSRMAQRKNGLRVGLLCLLSAAVVVVLSGEPNLNGAIRSKIPTPGVGRIFESINWEQARPALQSRITFWNIAGVVIAKHPFFGVGLGEFRVVAPTAAREVGIDIAGWTDNANNLYLHLLAEFGISGVLLIVVSLYLLFVARPAGNDAGMDENESCYRRFALLTLIVCLILFVTGPHILFEEVRLWVFLTAGILILHAGRLRTAGEGVTYSDIIGGWDVTRALVGAGALIFLLGVCFSSQFPLVSGFYGVEGGPSEVTYRWIGRRAVARVCGPVSSITVRSIQPGISPSDPLRVSVIVPSQPSAVVRSVMLTGPEWQTIEIADVSPQVGNHLKLEVSRVWSPFRQGGEDRRYLGAMIQWPIAGVCRD